MGMGPMSLELLARRGNNGLGIAGVNWRVRLMACKSLGAPGVGQTSWALRCLDYIARMRDRGVNLVAVNASWGGGVFSVALRDAIATLLQRGILFVAAAGNSAMDNDFVADLLRVVRFAERDLRSRDRAAGRPGVVFELRPANGAFGGARE